MKKVVYLFGIHFLSFFHKLRHELVRELVVGFCTLILLALFYYVFNDFINLELKNISIPMRDRFAEILAWILILGAAFAAGRMLRPFFVEARSLLRSSLLIGEAPRTRTALGYFHGLLVLSLVYVPIWTLIDRKLIHWSELKIVSICCFMILLSLVIRFLKQTPNQDTKKELYLPESHSSRNAMLLWRLQILFKRNRLTQFCFVMSSVCACTLVGAAYLSLPFPAVFILSFWGGFLGACALCFQLAEDLEASYLEKSSGVSHQTFLTMLFILTLLVGTFLGFVHSALWIFTKMLTTNFSFDILSDALRIFVITGIPSWIVPAVIFQIDGRRSVISILVSFLIGIFLATAIYASWFALALLPLIAYYGFTTQDGRFYRA